MWAETWWTSCTGALESAFEACTPVSRAYGAHRVIIFNFTPFLGRYVTVPAAASTRNPPPYRLEPRFKSTFISALEML
jgi:hypothetical protein